MWSQILKNGLLDKLTTASREEKQDSPKLRALNEAVDYFKNKGDFELYSGVQAMKSLRFERQQHQKNRDAEESHARKTVWGYEDKDGGEDEEMAEEFVNFGEININAPTGKPPTSQDPSPTPQPTPETPSQPKANGMPGWAKIALGTLLGAAVSVGPTAYFMRPQPPTPQPGGSIFRFDTELPPWMQDDDQ